MVLTPGFLAAASEGLQTILVHPNGAVEFGMPGVGGKVQQVRIEFGLPSIAASGRTREGAVRRSQWETNGIRYTQTVLWKGTPTNAPVEASPVLLIEIEGLNTATEYREATASLSLHINGRPLELELRAGAVYDATRPDSAPLAALEVPESGIKAARGRTLQFYGFMPPSINGSMTLKWPLGTLAKGSLEWLHDLELQQVLREAARKPQPDPKAPKLLFSEETPRRDHPGTEGSAG